MVAKPREPCYTVSRIRIEGQEAYEGWKTGSAPRVAEACTGSLLSSYEQAMIPAIYRRAELLWMTLVLAPILEEGAFRLVLYGWLRRFMAFLPAAVISSLAFGIYHGNWIQGTYAFLLGMVLAWGYEGSEYRKYPMAVLMHGAANLAALAAFG